MAKLLEHGPVECSNGLSSKAQPMKAPEA